MNAETIYTYSIAAIVVCGILYAYPRIFFLILEKARYGEIMRAHKAIEREATGEESARCTCNDCEIGRTHYKINL